MTEENTSGAFTPEETAYFESGGESSLPAATDPQVETPPEPGAQEQPQQTESGQQTERDEKGRFVPHQALHAEREEHKKTKAELEEMRQFKAVMEDRWNTLLKVREKPQQEEAPPPDPDQDIFGFAKWQKAELDKLSAKIADQERQTTERQQIESQEREIWTAWSADATAYAAATPEFGDAVAFLSEARAKQLATFAAIDPRMSTKEGVNQQINAELRNIVMQAKQAGVSPAKMVHDIAISYGFQAKPAAMQKPALPDQLASVAKAQEAAKTIGQAGGTSGGDALTPEAIAAMPPQEFNAWYSKPENARFFDKLMGG